MIYTLHYILFNVGLASILILLTLYLETYSQASLTEVGTLLMVLPFISILTKPLFCALADRQQAHRAYLIGSLLLMSLGYGSLMIAPFFPQLIEEHGRLVWYLDVLGIVVGFSAFGVAWSLGDALAVNAARVNGVPWATYRVWATVAWGLGGCLTGQINELSFLPKYTPAFMLLVFSLLLEVLALAVTPARYFDMSGATPGEAIGHGGNSAIEQDKSKEHSKEQQQQQQQQQQQEDSTNWPAQLSGGGTLSGSARFNPRLMGALANVMMEDLGETLRSTISGRQNKRAGLGDLLEQHKVTGPVLHSTGMMAAGNFTPQLARSSFASNSPQLARLSSASNSPQLARNASIAPTSTKAQQQIAAGGASPSSFSTRTSTFGKAALRRTQLALSGMNSLSSATGHAIADDLFYDQQQQQIGSPKHQRPQMMIMSSLASNTSLSRAAAARALAFQNAPSSLKDSTLTGISGAAFDPKLANSNSNGSEELGLNSALQSKAEEKQQEDLQIVLLKVIVKRDPQIIKYLLLLTLMGILFSIHIAYFFMHVERLCREKDYEFSHVMGALTIVHSISEVFCFMVLVPYYMPFVGRFGSMLTSLTIFAMRYGFYASYYVDWSPYTAIVTETGHGFAYGITYSLITEIAGECVDKIDNYLPELIERGIVEPSVNPNLLKLPLRATMYGVFSGAFDGLGNGIGALIAGIYLDAYTFVGLWTLCFYGSVVIATLYIISEWRLILRCNKK